MLIQVGELAKRAGITVRTLHHYEQLGLLLPSARSAAGYRFYNLADVQRLHMIQVLAKAGLDLAAIKDFLEQQSLTLPELLNAQIGSLETPEVLGWLQQAIGILMQRKIAPSR